jgi:hypothetical protein
MVPRIVLLFTVTLLPSCSYMLNRARDAHECLLVDAQFGLGISADAKAGPFGAGVGGSYSWWSFGKSTWSSGLQSFREISLGVPLLQAGGVKAIVVGKTGEFHCWFLLITTQMLVKRRQLKAEHAVEDDSSVVPGSASQQEDLLLRFAPLGIPLCFNIDRHIVDLFGFETSAFLGVVGARVGFNVAEFGDFMLGWFGLDILGDDVHPEEKNPKKDSSVNKMRVSHHAACFAHSII